MKKLIITGLILLFAAGLYSAQTTVNTSSDTFKTAWDRQQAMNTELYGKWTSLGATHDTGAELDALYEGELTNEAGLYAALSDVDDFVQTTEIDTAAELESVANLGAYASDILAATNEANLKSIINLEIGTDVQAYDADLTTYAGITPSANIQSFLGAATYQAALDLLESSDYTPTGAIDFTSASSVSFGPLDAGGGTLEIPNSATPTTDATGEIALDTTITDHQPLIQYYNGSANMTVIAIDTSELPALDNEIVKYDAATDKFVLEADAGAAGGDSVSVDGVGVTDPDLVSTGDIDVVDTSNTITFNLNADVVDETKIADDGVDSEHYNDRSVDSVHINSYSDSTVLAEPDQLQPISDAWLIKYFPAETFPSGVTIDAIHITTSATCTDVLNFEEWTQSGTSSSSTVEEITLSGTFTEDDGTLSDASIAADGRLMVDLPATPTDIAFYEITVIYHAN